MDAARAEFALHGSTVPLSRIAKRAGVGQGSLYRHFPGRTALAAAVFREDVENLCKQVEAAENPYTTLMNTIQERAPEAAALIDLLTAEEDLPDQAEALRSDLEGLVREVRRASVAAGHMPQRATEEELAAAIRMFALTLAHTAESTRQNTALRARRIIDSWFQSS
ncbi:TetR/AcrR family transcriptional regulator [Nesterenkonia rhizosphaerae]|uniref:TetR/AcrR family transcriptional regulator n=1 Tax=Nesterenkonia rhizosphaerae TaxID=1348272 RepID=A0ABP9FRT2_9MICC